MYTFIHARAQFGEIALSQSPIPRDNYLPIDRELLPRARKPERARARARPRFQSTRLNAVIIYLRTRQHNPVVTRGASDAVIVQRQTARLLVLGALYLFHSCIILRAITGTSSPTIAAAGVDNNNTGGRRVSGRDLRS